MTMRPDTDCLLSQTEAAQARASSPTTSAWVSANAGAGKTHVLKLRVLRLLLGGTPPERILCLTYTKAAAAEMSQRVFADLAKWTTASGADLEKMLAKLLGRAPTQDETSLGRQLFARAIETPGGLKVQTIHAFCERLLQRFPLEAGASPGFTILDEDLAASLRREAINITLGEANADPASPLGQALRLAVVRAADERFDQILGVALQRRQWIEDMGRLARQHADGEQNFKTADLFYRRIFQIDEQATTDALRCQQANVLTISQLSAAAGILQAGGKRDRELAGMFMRAASAPSDTQRRAALAQAFLKKDGKPRSDSQFVSKGLRTAEPGIADRLLKARDAFHALTQKLTGLEMIETTLALLCLSTRVLEHYNDAKDRRAALDFEDLIDKTSRLLAAGEAANWILYKLDGGLDHILVDEAQDTSPLQWKIVEALAAEFFSGEGASEAERSVFAVGDEKQSIYSFQGAAPEQFARAGRRFAGKVKGIGGDWADVPLTLSFRTVKPLLDAVDAIFADEGRTPGINFSDNAVRHQALRLGEAGCFEIWPTIRPKAHDPAPAFAPFDDATPRPPAAMLAEKVADQIQVWLESGEILKSKGRRVCAGDFLILVRRRQPFAPQIVRALKSRKIPVAGADRIMLTEQLVVQDLLALADFLLLPQDDLALASVLKSPLFNIDDDDLLLFAPERKGSLWAALLAHVNDTGAANARLSYAVQMLKRWQALVNFALPYEFFATLLDRDGGRARLLGRLGPDAADPLDEFMDLALAYDQQAPASLQGFTGWLRTGSRQIKRDMDQARDEVRVMTVHGAKGLEAPIVLLPDTCAAPGGGLPNPLVDLAGTEVPEEQAAPQVWAVKGAGMLRPITDGRAVTAKRELEEHHRLLYVALTRAQDRVYVMGFEGKRGRAKNCWYDTIWQGLDGQLNAIETENGETIWRLETPQTVAPTRAPDNGQTAAAAITLPAWALTKVPHEPQLTIPLVPSRLTVPPGDDGDERRPAAESGMDVQPRQPEEPAFPSPRTITSDNGLLRGTLIHTLFEHLPDYPEADRYRIAKQYLEVNGKDIGSSIRTSMIEEVLDVMSDAACAAAFAQGSRAEVPIVADLVSPLPDSPPLRLSGRIDRLIRSRDGILIVDFKSNRRPPPGLDRVPAIYLLQLAAYRLALQKIFPGEAVRAALLWTAAPVLMEIPVKVLDDHQQGLWQLGQLNLDAA